LAYAGPAGLLGGQPIDRELLRASLKSLVKHFRMVMWLATGMVLLLYLVGLGLALNYIDRPKILVGIGGAMGLTFAGAIETVRRIGREMAQTNLLVALSGELDADALKPIITALARKL
jgi:hypothetical protein